MEIQLGKADMEKLRMLSNHQSHLVRMDMLEKEKQNENQKEMEKEREKEMEMEMER